MWQTLHLWHGSLGAYSEQNREDVLWFEAVVAVAKDDWVAMANDNVHVTKGNTEGTEAR